MLASRTVPMDVAGIVVYSDSSVLLEECSDLGFAIKNIMQAESLEKNSVVFSFSDLAAKRTFELAKATKEIRCIFFPVHVFEASLENAIYSFKLFLESDIQQAVAEQKSVLELVNSGVALELFGQGAEAVVDILEGSVPYAILEGDLQGGFVHSVAEFFEVHFAHMKPQEPCPFAFEGELRVAGILTVLRKPESVDINIKDSLKDLVGEVARKQAIVKVRKNTVVSFKVEGHDYIDLIQRAAGTRGAKLTEFAIGVNRAITPSIDYSINSQMNEGVSGIHVAVGDGTTGYHIDFLCPGVFVRAS